eukprot:gene20626-22661_t
MILEEQKFQYASIVKRTVENLKKEGGGMKEDTFWEFKRKLAKRKEETPIAMTNKEGELKESRNEILDIYRKHHEDLFKVKTAATEKERETEQEIEMKFERIKETAKQQEPMFITEEEVEIAIKKMKLKKAGDEEGWKNELIKWGGPEMTKSIHKMFNKIISEGPPKQWSKMTIKSIYKNKGSKSEVGNRRGIFLTSVMSKLLEKIILHKTESLVKVDKYQSGGRKQCGTVDNWMVLIAILDNNRRLNKKTYLILADAEKCFDKLWLKDCLVDLCAAGMREREIDILHKLNEKAEIRIKTPVGTTEEIIVKNIVKQGTVFGPVLCCANSVKVNDIITGNISTVISPEIELKALAYVDDIMGAGSREHVEGVGRNLKEMESRKKYTFNNANGKSHYMIVKTGREQEEIVDIQVEKGKITRTQEYKYLGNWITEKGTVEKQLEMSGKKVKGMIEESKKIAAENRTGIMSTDIAILLYERTIIPAMLYNLEVWTRWRNSDWDSLEKIQAESLKKLLKLPTATPYWGILNELGMWTMKARVILKRMMLLHRIMNSNEDRLCKYVLKEQKRMKWRQCWYDEVAEEGKRHGIPVEEVDKYQKKEWKKIVMERIEKNMKEESEKAKKVMKKLERQKEQKWERQQYTRQNGIETVSMIMKTKLKMWDIGKNMGGARLCYGCKNEEETMEHVYKCEKVKEIIDGSGENTVFAEAEHFKQYVAKRQQNDKM